MRVWCRRRECLLSTPCLPFTTLFRSIFSRCGVVVAFGMLLDNVSDIAEATAGFDQLNTFIEAFLSDFNQPLGMGLGRSHEEHLAGISVLAVHNQIGRASCR